MPGALPVRPPSVSTTGYADGLGRRVIRFDREAGAALESLQLRPELSVYEHALRVQAAAIAALGDDRFAPVRSIEREASRVVVMSELATGDRLSDIIEARTAGDGGVSGLDAAFGFLLHMLPVLSRLHAAGLVHGIVAPGRILLTTSARVTLCDNIYGAILPRLNLSRQRLWNELQVAAPPSAGVVRFDASADVSQAALCSLMLVLGRSLEGQNPIDSLPQLLAEAIEIAQIRGGDRLAEAVGRFFKGTLPVAGLRSGVTADQAAQDARAIVSGELGEEGCVGALAEFVRYEAPPPPVPKPRATQVRIAPPPPPPPAPVRVVEEPDPPVIEFEDVPAVSTESEYVAPPEPEPVPIPEPVVEVEPKYEPVAQAESVYIAPSEPIPVPAPAPIPVPVVEMPPVVAAVPRFEPPQVAKPVPVIEPPQVASPPPVQTFVPPPPPEPVHVAPPVVAKAPPEPEPLIPRAPIERSFDPDAFAPPPVVAPPQVIVPPPPPPPMPVFRPSTPPVVAPNPYVFSPGSSVTPIAAAPPPPPPAPVQPYAPAPLRLKQDAPTGYAPPRLSPRYEQAMVDPPFMRRQVEEVPSGFPKKMAIAALLVMAVAIGGGRYLMTRDRAAAAEQSKTTAAAAKPEPVVQAKTPTPAGSTGTLTIETIPTGAKVLLNGTHAGETPLKLEGLPAGRHTVTLVTDSVTVKRTVRVEAGKTVALDVPVFSGWVAVFAPIVLEVSEGNKGLGSTEQGRILLSPGRHVLTVTNRQLGYSSTHEIEISAGEETPLNLTPTGRVNLNAVPWAEVWLDGIRVGETPIANLEVPLGTREFVFKHPQHGERRVTTTVTATPAAVSVDFTKPGFPNVP